MRKNYSFKLTALLIALVTIDMNSNAQTDRSGRLRQAKKAIGKINLTYFNLYAKNDGSILSLYTKDACLMPANAPSICGEESLAKDFKDTYAAGVVKGGKFTTTEVYGDAIEYVTEEGLWEVFDANGQAIDKGKYLKLWKKTKEGWKMFRDFFSSNHKPEK